jgi:NAD(P)-dependent dehydrogenase (short-subunit alcohol dehydrogenase family)
MTEEFPRPTRSLKGRVAIVSGAGAAGDGIGNGRASAILLAEAGANIVCVDMALDLAQRTAELIEKDGHSKAIAVQANVTSEDDARNVVSKTVEAFGRIDILVNVVGVGGASGTAEDVDMVEWAKGMEINVASMVIMAKYCIPVMSKNEGQWRGSIVNIASVAGIRGGTPHLLYPTSKGAIVVSCLPKISQLVADWT